MELSEINHELLMRMWRRVAGCALAVVGCTGGDPSEVGRSSSADDDWGRPDASPADDDTPSQTNGSDGGSAPSEPPTGNCANDGTCQPDPPDDTEQTTSPSYPCVGACSDDVEVRPKPGPPPSCPGDEPQEGTDCARDGEVCSYGDGIATCRAVLYCDDGTWQDPQPTVSCPTAPDCPQQQPEQGSACAVPVDGPGAACRYEGAVHCYCGWSARAYPGSDSEWECWGPPRDERCPAELPNYGEGCTPQGLECNYSPDACFTVGSSVFCFDGVWEGSTGLSCE